MFEKVGFENILKNKTVAGLEIIAGTGSNYRVNSVVLSKKKSELKIEEKHENCSTLEEAVGKNNLNNPFVVLLNGRGIIHRKIAVTENDTTTSLLHKILPNANAEEFALQQTAVNANESFVSVIRIKQLNEIVEMLQKAGIVNIAACFLGPFVVSNIIPLLGEQVQLGKLTFSNYTLSLDGTQISDIVTAETYPDNERMRLNNEYISSLLLLPFAAGISYYTGLATGIENAENINTLKQNYQLKQKIEITGKAALIGAFAILLFNYFVFDYYWQKSKQLDAVFELNQSALQQYEKLKAEFENKKILFQQNGLLESSRTSFYADKLAAELPAGIQWTDLNMNPVKKVQNAEQEDLLVFENNTITIAGKCRRSADLNDWIKTVKSYSWVINTSLIDYKQDNANESGSFLIKIELKS